MLYDFTATLTCQKLLLASPTRFLGICSCSIGNDDCRKPSSRAYNTWIKLGCTASSWRAMLALSLSVVRRLAYYHASRKGQESFMTTRSLPLSPYSHRLPPPVTPPPPPLPTGSDAPSPTSRHHTDSYPNSRYLIQCGVRYLVSLSSTKIIELRKMLRKMHNARGARGPAPVSQSSRRRKPPL